MSDRDRKRLREIHTFPALVKYLREDLGWPVEQDNFADLDDITFDWGADELGIDPDHAAKIEYIKQLRPLEKGQPEGVFFVKFNAKGLPVVALRRLLSKLVIKKRATAKAAEQPLWAMRDLVFISSYGSSEERQLSFAYFQESEQKTELPTLKVLGWDDHDTALHLDRVHDLLNSHLRWPANPQLLPTWRKEWSKAFELRHGQVVSTAKELAEQLAALAKGIRERANQLLKLETENGPLRTLMAGFKAALIHDLTEDHFADMYAQTIAYGLLSARITHPDLVKAETLPDLIPVTNPFLKELMETFVLAGGKHRNRKKGVHLDFDELGISDVVDLLRNANMDAVLRNFGASDRKEDPVTYFYEDFLNAYDAKERKRRGVYYTPKPVVSYIVRSLHELLQTEFGIEDGLASTITWDEMAKRNADLEIPDAIDPDSPFVEILDPATGTATFLVEVIDVILITLKAQWSKLGFSEAKQTAAWNAYVPRHLLPRLHGYELMMAPYTIAHLKIGLKLFETGYLFGSGERARVYLTNALEPATDASDSQIDALSEALAHEADAVNEVKRLRRFTVVVGNPPYSGLSANMGAHAQALVDAYKVIDGEALNERKLWLQDDYVKFIRLAQLTIERSGAGLVGYISNHGYIGNPTFRGMRQSLLATFPRLRVLNLHGNANKREQSPDGSEDNNVFDIRQGVAICLANRSRAETTVLHADLWGSRPSKYSWLSNHCTSDTNFTPLTPDSPFYFFESQNTDDRAEYDAGWKVTDIFLTHGVGVVMARDSMTVDFDADALWRRVKDFASLPPEKARIKYALGDDARDWRVATAQADIQASGPSKTKISSIMYRPFDARFTYYTGQSRGFYASPCRKVMSNMVSGDNIGIALSRNVEIGQFEHVFCTRGIVGHHSVSLKEVNYLCPLWLLPSIEAPASLFKGDGDRQPNLAPLFIRALTSALSLDASGPHGLPVGVTPEDIFHYAYAVFHSPGYRNRYAGLLKIDFPRLPLPGSLALFRALARMGGELTTMHLLESPKLKKPITTFGGPRNADVGRICWVNDTVWVDAAATKKGQDTVAGTIGFKGVPEGVWNFRVGGYQVCEKWLKDRKGRKLSMDDIEHYQKIIVALSETIRIMKEIDQVIDRHGGWPGAFARGTVAGAAG